MRRPLFEKKETLVEQLLRYLNSWLLFLFTILWLSDCGLTLWATNNGYTEVWNKWTMLIAHTWIFVVAKLLTLVLVIGIVRFANNIFPHFIFIALIVFNILVGTVTVANIITIVN